VIIRGETVHAQLIGESVTEAITRLQIDFGVPIIHEVLLLENIQQAENGVLILNIIAGMKRRKQQLRWSKLLNQFLNLNLNQQF